jgi:hypothetical protein
MPSHGRHFPPNFRFAHPNPWSTLQCPAARHHTPTTQHARPTQPVLTVRHRQDRNGTAPNTDQHIADLLALHDWNQPEPAQQHAPAPDTFALPALPAHIDAEYIVNATLDEIRQLLPIYQQRAAWLTQQEVSLDTKLHHITARLQDPYHPGAPPATHLPPSHPLHREPPSTALRICNTIYSACERWTRVNAAWHTFATTHHVTDWHHVTAPLTADFHAYLTSLHNTHTPDGHWQPQHNLVTALRDIFGLTCMVDGAIWPTNFPRLIPHQQPMSHAWHDYLRHPAPADFLWCTQESTPPLQPLLS